VDPSKPSPCDVSTVKKEKSIDVLCVVEAGRDGLDRRFTLAARLRKANLLEK
jgi:hypothetical protein